MRWLLRSIYLQGSEALQALQAGVWLAQLGERGGPDATVAGALVAWRRHEGGGGLALGQVLAAHAAIDAAGAVDPAASYVVMRHDGETAPLAALLDGCLPDGGAAWGSAWAALLRQHAQEWAGAPLVTPDEAADLAEGFAQLLMGSTDANATESAPAASAHALLQQQQQQQQLAQTQWLWRLSAQELGVEALSRRQLQELRSAVLVLVFQEMARRRCKSILAEPSAWGPGSARWEEQRVLGPLARLALPAALCGGGKSGGAEAARAAVLDALQSPGSTLQLFVPPEAPAGAQQQQQQGQGQQPGRGQPQVMLRRGFMEAVGRHELLAAAATSIAGRVPLHGRPTPFHEVVAGLTPLERVYAQLYDGPWAFACANLSDLLELLLSPLNATNTAVRRAAPDRARAGAGAGAPEDAFWYHEVEGPRGGQPRASAAQALQDTRRMQLLSDGRVFAAATWQAGPPPVGRATMGQAVALQR
ncbi:MAG: hypothetical protein J3K34DRAFT_517888 [Monoraphidium minutum]|nr:MAG: hypothetical protein J3K34DRAFT_517888 [Monoraphidium minutum]